MIFKYGEFEELKARLINRRIVKWESSKLTLDDGTEVIIDRTEQSCCEEAGGEFSNVELDALITNVSYPELTGLNTEFDSRAGYAKVTIFHNRNEIAVADLFADSGSTGCYYSLAFLAIKDVYYPIVDIKGLAVENGFNDTGDY